MGEVFEALWEGDHGSWFGEVVCLDVDLQNAPVGQLY